jgi:hypothetical protein
MRRIAAVFLVLALSAWAAGPASATDGKELRVRLRVA